MDPYSIPYIGLFVELRSARGFVLYSLGFVVLVAAMFERLRIVCFSLGPGLFHVAYL